MLPAPRWSSKVKTVFGNFIPRTKLKDQHLKKIRSLAIASLFLAPVILGAAETNALPIAEAVSATNTLEEITVTATRIATPQEKSPTAITVITREEIEQSQQHLVADVLRGQPGVAVAATGLPGSQTSVFLRGAEMRNTLVLVDGIKLNDVFNGGYDFSQLAAESVERIEILRGPQSTLYGSDAAGGVINIVTKRGTSEPSGWVQSEYGSFNTSTTSGGFSASKGKLSIGGDGSYSSSDNDRANSDYQQYHFDGRARYDFSDRFSATLLANYFHNNDGSPSDIYTQDPTARLKTESALFGLTLNADPTDWWNAKLILSHAQARFDYNDPSYANAFPANNSSPDGDLTLDHRNQIDFQNVFTLTEKNKLLLGGSFENDYADNNVWASGVNPNNFGGYTNGTSRTFNSGAVYGEYDYNPFKCLTLTAGGRDEFNSAYGTHATYKVGARYTAPTATIFRASLGSGYQTPSISQLYGPASWGSNPNLRPEKSVGWDAGIEQPLLNNRLRIGATFFHNDYDDLIAYSSGGNLANISRARTFGVETFVAWQVLTNLTARASYTWLNTENLDTGVELARRPEHSGSLNLNWQIIPKLQMDATVLFVGERADFNPLTYTTKAGLDSSYIKSNLALRWQVQKHLEIFARAENLTDAHYQEAFGYPALGRGFYGGLRAQF